MNNTRIGRALQKVGNVAKPILNLLSKVPVPGAELLGEVADAIRTTKEITAEQKEELLHAISMDMQDLANARKHNADVQTSQFSTTMAKNVPYVIDMFVLLVWGIFTFYIVGVVVKIISASGIDTAPLMAMYSGVCLMAGQVLNFHRGSTQGSRMKDAFK